MAKHKDTYRIVSHNGHPEAVIGFRHNLNSARALAVLYCMENPHATVRLQRYTTRKADFAGVWATIETHPCTKETCGDKS
jgi:hypothetical protein